MLFFSNDCICEARTYKSGRIVRRGSEMRQAREAGYNNKFGILKGQYYYPCLRRLKLHGQKRRKR